MEDQEGQQPEGRRTQEGFSPRASGLQHWENQVFLEVS